MTIVPDARCLDISHNCGDNKPCSSTRIEPTMANVLLIDDDPTIIPEQVRQAFPRPDHRVKVAGTGADGLAEVQADAPDVILLDLLLPDQTGLEVYEKIRKF